MNAERPFSLLGNDSYTLSGGGDFAVNVSLESYQNNLQNNMERRIRTIEHNNDLLSPPYRLSSGLTEKPKKRAPAITVDRKVPDDTYGPLSVSFCDNQGETVFSATTGDELILWDPKNYGDTLIVGRVRVTKGSLMLETDGWDENAQKGTKTLTPFTISSSAIVALRTDETVGLLFPHIEEQAVSYEEQAA